MPTKTLRTHYLLLCGYCLSFFDDIKAIIHDTWGIRWQVCKQVYVSYFDRGASLTFACILSLRCLGGRSKRRHTCERRDKESWHGSPVFFQGITHYPSYTLRCLVACSENLTDTKRNNKNQMKRKRRAVLSDNISPVRCPLEAVVQAFGYQQRPVF